MLLACFVNPSFSWVRSIFTEGPATAARCPALSAVNRKDPRHEKGLRYDGIYSPSDLFDGVRVYHNDWLANLFMPESIAHIVGEFRTSAALDDYCIGDDCEECKIPEAYKTIASQSDIDVIEYLGLRRVEPLRKEI